MVTNLTSACHKLSLLDVSETYKAPPKRAFHTSQVLKVEGFSSVAGCECRIKLRCA